jgi:hypothetical protein
MDESGISGGDAKRKARQGKGKLRLGFLGMASGFSLSEH